MIVSEGGNVTIRTSVAPTYKNVPAVIATIIPSISGVAILDINTPAVTPRGPD
jgi:hypothetical protein